jgi:hypothetical protein
MTVTASIPPPPSEVPTTPSGVPVVAGPHVGLERAVEAVTEALCALATGLVSTADEEDFPAASRMAQTAHTLTYELRQHVLGRRVKAMQHRRTGSPS